jgi:DNA-binding NarL/FixJ family response regulator
MILLYSSTQESKLRIASLVQKQTDMAIAIAPTQKEIVELACQHRPQTIFLFMPGQTATAIDIQNYLRELLPHARVRILSSVHGTELLLDGWQGVVVRALSRPAIRDGDKKESGK